MASYSAYIKTADQRAAVDALREMLPPGALVRTRLISEARSGMSRTIEALATVDGREVSLDNLIAETGAFKIAKNGHIRMDGCGMDMGFALVYSLSSMLYNDGGICTGSSGYTPTGRKSKAPRCGSNDHTNGDRVYRKGKRHADGGYTLHQSWTRDSF